MDEKVDLARGVTPDFLSCSLKVALGVSRVVVLLHVDGAGQVRHAG